MTGPSIGGVPRHYGPQHQWTDADDRIAVQMRTNGFSAREIARKISSMHPNCRLSRLAVIGRLSRLKFKDPNTKSDQIKGGIKEKKLRPISEIHDRKISISKSAGQMPEMDDYRSGTISLAHARECDCRYPVGDPRKLQVCGQPIESGSSYCHEHILRCFASVKPVPAVSAGVAR